ncbi:hypothetical protein Zmor_014765 [Zophobas morio]|uniref:Uncharacterized protein n=1 Tax=Zophobas morio TaxID=2755281 RepID=A0AA38MH48_9CUCU|nr:hypothetical protein Zmor_014765 [Zophobas morio]
MEYASVTWCPYLHKDIDLLERAQRRATKMVKTLRNAPYSQRLKELSLCSLSESRSKNDLVWTFKILNGYLSADLASMFNINHHEHLRGHRLKLTNEIYKSRSRENFLGFQCMERSTGRSYGM